MTFKFKDWFFRQFPDWHQEYDVNKNSLGEGTFQRYLRIFGLELDEEFIPYLENWLDIIDLQKTDDKYLPLIADILGNPPSVGDNAVYRNILASFVAIYKVKGTKTSFKLFFNFLGLEAKIIEATPAIKITYDMPGVTYDKEPTMYTYDSFCDNCSGYWIGYHSVNDTSDPFVNNVVPQETLDKLNNIICFLQPINAKLLGMVKTIALEDLTELNISETVEVDGNGIEP